MPLAKCPEIDGGALREARLRLKLSQKTLGRLCGEKYEAPMEGTNVSRIEAGTHNPTPARRAILELTLGMEIGSLLRVRPERRQDIPRPAVKPPTPTRAAAA
jgi:transcriptional regulator with XRE-family HTH domain